MYRGWYLQKYFAKVMVEGHTGESKPFIEVKMKWCGTSNVRDVRYDHLILGLN